MRPAADQPTARHRLTVQEAASRLGVTVDAIRGRIKRGTLSSDRDEDGTVYVLLEHADQPDDQLGASHQPADDQLELVEVLQEQNDYLRRQLEVWQEEARRKDHIIAALAERIPAIEAPQDTASEATGAAESDEDAPYGTSSQEAEDSLQRRPSWWKRFFGLE
jgi:DNA polymerase elongation subunit (family B)